MSKKTNKATPHSKTLLLVDGSSYLFRAFHALPPLTNSKGISTGAVFGVIKMLRKEILAMQPALLAVVFDAKGKTFRDTMYPQYKANRPPMPDDLREQIEPLHTVLKALGFPLLCVSGVEADDVIGTLARQAEKLSIPVVISSGDKDFAQLVSDKITLVNTMTNTTMDIVGVEKKFGVTPAQIVDYLALVGDSADNVPGVSKVGPKTAVKWLTQYNSVEEIIDHAEDIKGKVGENLREGIEQLKLSQRLVTIKCDVELESSPKELTQTDPDLNQLKELFADLEFNTLLAEVSGNDESVKVIEREQADYETIFDQSVLDQWITKLSQAEIFAFDTETTSIDSMTAELVGLSFAVKSGEAAYVPLMHDYPGAPIQLDRDKVLAQLKPLLESGKPRLIGQHIKYDMNVLSHYDIEINSVAHDTMLASYVVNSTSRHDMDNMALKHLGINTIHFEDVAGKGAKQLTFNQVGIEEAGPYAAEDADITLQLNSLFSSELQKSDKLKKVYDDIEIPLIYVLSRIERNGVLLDDKMLQAQSIELETKIESLQQQAYEIAGETFNLGSPKQLQNILFEKNNLPIIKKTPKGQPSTAEDVLQELALDYPLPKVILEYRSASKLKSTYVDKLPKQINTRTGRVHTSYHQAVAATGRLSSSDPNLQNIPVRSGEGRKIRKAFIAPKGFDIVAADYSQIELRIMAHLSGDERLLDAFSKGLDVHQATAAEVFAIKAEEVTTDQRRSAKAINFGLIYGMSAFGLAKQLGIGRSAAQTYVDLYFERYPGVKKYMDETRELAHEQGYVETVYGRRLYLPEINSKNAMRRQYAERTAINAPMQGTAADVIKRAMINVQGWLDRESASTQIIMQVHDELVFEIKQEDRVAHSKIISDLMTGAAELRVPLLVDVGHGLNWDEAH
ncbi:DNA polymerase I [hydrothermal vent metagenome]|uniref:DNA-directed DNA polymerase n=1 Tax=hydrothermal vent metagenome TaxID=652676 RepID=A0A3B0YLG4_9ZZZZ